MYLCRLGVYVGVGVCACVCVSACVYSCGGGMPTVLYVSRHVLFMKYVSTLDTMVAESAIIAESQLSQLKLQT